jgi:hypothetical protein
MTQAILLPRGYRPFSEIAFENFKEFVTSMYSPWASPKLIYKERSASIMLQP